MPVFKGALALLPVALALAACDSGKDAPPQEQAQGAGEAGRKDIALTSPEGAGATLSYAHAGTPAPADAFTGPDGKQVRIDDFAGRRVLVNLWATWCAPCKAEMPTLEKLAGAGDPVVLAISQDLDGMAAVGPYFKEQGFKALKPYLDRETRLMAATGAASLPTTILYDTKGREVWRVTGGAQWDGPQLAERLREGR